MKDEYLFHTKDDLHTIEITRDSTTGEIEFSVDGLETDEWSIMARVLDLGDPFEQTFAMNALRHMLRVEGTIEFERISEALVDYMRIKDTMIRNRTEYYYQQLFIDSVPRIFGPDTRVIHKDNLPDNIPDLWIESAGSEIPVEIKKWNFDTAALKQLKRYMWAYKTQTGIAVGNKLTVKLPKGITFIPLSDFVSDSELPGKI